MISEKYFPYFSGFGAIENIFGLDKKTSLIYLNLFPFFEFELLILKSMNPARTSSELY
jgi:hypothetical protein